MLSATRLGQADPPESPVPCALPSQAPLPTEPRGPLERISPGERNKPGPQTASTQPTRELLSPWRVLAPERPLPRLSPAASLPGGPGDSQKGGVSRLGSPSASPRASSLRSHSTEPCPPPQQPLRGRPLPWCSGTWTFRPGSQVPSSAKPGTPSPPIVCSRAHTRCLESHHLCHRAAEPLSQQDQGRGEGCGQAPGGLLGVPSGPRGARSVGTNATVPPQTCRKDGEGGWGGPGKPGLQ